MADQQYTLSLVFLTSTDAAGIQALQQQVQSLETELKRLTTQQQQQAQETEKGANAARQLNDGLRVLQASMLAVAGVSAVFKKAFDMAEAGAQLQRTEDRFGRLAGTIETTGDSLLEKMREVTGGITSDATLMGSAVDIIGLKLATTEEETLRLVNVVTKLGLDMQQLILTFANDSEKRLDQLGLAIDDVRGKADEFERQGFDASKAFDMAVLVALEERLALLGGGVEDNAAIFARFETQIANITDGFKMWLAEGLTPVLAALSGTNAGKVEELVDSQRDAAETLRDYVIAGKRLSEVADMWGGLATGITGTTGTVRDKLRDIATDIALNTGNMAEFRTAFERAFSYGAQTDILRVGTAAEITLEQFFRLAQETERLAQAYANSYRPATSQAATETEQLATSAADAGIAIRDGTGEIAGWVGMMDMLGTGTHAAALSNRELAGTTYEIRAAAEPLPSIIRDMTAAMVEQREANQQMQVEFNAGITAYLNGADALDYYKTEFEDLGTVTYEYTTIAGGNRAELERLQGVYEQALQDIRDYEAGIKGTTLSEEARAKKLDELRQKAENTQTAMVGLGEAVVVTGEKFNAAEFDAQALRLALLEQMGAAGAGTLAMQQIMEATGAYSDEQIRAALNAAAMQEKIEALAGMVADGTITVEDAIERLDDFAEALAQPFGIYVETGPLRGAISELERLIALYGTAAGLAGAIDAGSGSSGGGGGSNSGGGGWTGDTGDTRMAGGGWVRGGAAGYDSVPAWLMPGERVVSVQEVAGAGGAAAVDSMIAGSGGGDTYIFQIPDQATAHVTAQVVSHIRRQERYQAMRRGGR